MKRVQEVLRYDGATIAQVREMLATPAFREEVCDYQRVLRKEVSITADGDVLSVRIDQYQGTERVPAFAKRLVGEEIHIVQIEEWRAPDRGDLRMEIPGKPGRMHGTAVLAESDGGVTETVDLTVEVSLPLIGGKIEGLIADLLGKALRAEQKVGRDWLASRSAS